MTMHRHQQNKQSPVGAFRIDDATVVHGRVAHGWYEVFDGGRVHGPLLSEPHVPPSRQHQRPVLGHLRFPAIHGKRRMLSLYGQVG
jgi:hypothetical protein